MLSRQLFLQILIFTIVQQLVGEDNCKQQIEIKLKQYAIAKQEERGEIGLALAHHFLEDQNQKEAFRVFLETIDNLRQSEDITNLESADYKDALQIYLDGKSSPQENARTILQKYEKLALQSKDPSLGFLVSIAYANLDKYPQFFDLFFHSYKNLPNHFLAEKTKAILHIKLLERTCTVEGREDQRRRILYHLESAQMKAPFDNSLYKLMILYSLPQDKKERITKSITQIIEGDVKIPRSELFFYVQESVDQGEVKLAQRFIEKAKEWYPYSKSIESAEHYIQSAKQKGIG